MSVADRIFSFGTRPKWFLKTSATIIEEGDNFLPITTSVNLPTPKEIRTLYHQGEEAVVAVFEQLVTLIREFEARVQTLEDQLAKNSCNSHTPLPAMA